jgi:xanthine/CO dehydrogenase XdhC/CoxF family maturation factor
MSEREQPWTDASGDGPEHGRILVLSDNPIAQAIAMIGRAVGRDVLVEAADDGGPGLDPQPGDAVVLCDHDAPDAPAVLRAALASEAAYVAMMASRHRAVGVLADLAADAPIERLHVPAGHNLGGKGPGEIALSVVAEIVAESYGRPGGPMRG